MPMRTCKVEGCAAEFVATTSRRYCDDHRDPATRSTKKKAAKKAKKKRPPLHVPNDAQASPWPPSAPSSTTSPRELLELAGYRVREVVAPAGVMLLVEDVA